MAPYLSVPLQIPAGGTTPDGVSYTYTPNDASVGDLDGDGEYEIVLKWDPSNSHGQRPRRATPASVFSMRTNWTARGSGGSIWASNIRAGAHYTQFMVYDLDGDGRAEVACKTADGTVDGQGSRDRAIRTGLPRSRPDHGQLPASATSFRARST